MHQSRCHFGIHFSGVSDESIGTEQVAQHFGSCFQTFNADQCFGVPLLHGCESITRKLANRVLASRIPEHLQCIGSDLQVVVSQLRLTAVRKHVAARRASSTGLLVGYQFYLDESRFRERVQVAADRSRREAQLVSKLGGTDRSVL